MRSEDLLLVPRPKRVSTSEGGLRLPARGYIVLTGKEPHRLLVGARKLAQVLKGDWQVTASPGGLKTAAPIVLERDPESGRATEGYKLTISAEGVKITAADPAGVYYGVCTLLQVIDRHPRELPYLAIEDSPDFPSRGVMLDISRDRVPTLETLMEMVDLLSEWKVNQLQLYTEHTFQYIGHEAVWKDASPVTGEDILKLDAYCRERFVELVPNQNSFGHMSRWLGHKEYRGLAENPNSPSTLNPADPAGLKLVADLYDQLLPHFTSRNLNVGCDETSLGKGRSREACEKIGEGRVYLNHLLKLHELCTQRGRRMQFWGDIIKHHPELIPELPNDLIAVEWGYGADYSFKANCEQFASSGIEFWVCPGTGTWNTFVARAANAIQNPQNAAKEGLATGATGLLNTDWGDNGHHQFLPVSYLGYMSGAASSWNARGVETPKLIEGLSAFAFRDSKGVMGQVAYDLADSYTKIEKKVPNAGVPFWLLIGGRFEPEQLVEGIRAEELDAAIEAINGALARMKSAKMNRPDADLIEQELACNGAMVEIGCRIGRMHLTAKAGDNITRQRKSIASQLKQTIDDYSRLWLVRSRPGGLSDSRRRLEQALDRLIG